jgi:epoxyqueuosine reductase
MLADAVVAHAREELGFDLVGITDASPVAGAGRLAAWLAAGMHGEMGWMAETGTVRSEPARLLPGARSVICVALSYHDACEPPVQPGGAGRAVFARYARRKDYHDVIRPQLARLGRFLAARASGSRWRTAVDTAPLLERELAARAGLGWIGKNTCLINRRLGSELLLGELLTTVELPPDAPTSAHCGTCTACLDACPTRAFPAPSTLDARRCVSYLTVEHQSEVPAELAPAVAPHIAGCDICQAVCPWNRRAAPRRHPLLAPRPHLASPQLASLAGLDERGYLALTAGTPLRRLGFARFRRTLALLAIAPRRDGEPAVGALVDNGRQ